MASWFHFILVSLFFYSHLFGCTGIMLRDQKGSAISGRTVEFGLPLDMNVAFVPRKYSFVSKTPSGDGLRYRTKYAFMGVYCFSDEIIMDGMNEKGLTAAAFYFPGYADYAKITRANQQNALSPLDFTNWILSQFSTLNEVKGALKQVVIAPTSFKDWSNSVPPMHYIVYDRKGNSLVIEPIKGELVVHDNPIGVITNSPAFDWHLQNLNNYINLDPENVETYRMRKLQLTPFGEGSGLLGLPGDFTPPSRFIRAAFFSVYALPVKKSYDLISQAFHVLNQFDIPMGTVRAGKEDDRTQLTTVKDPESLAYYFKSYADQSIRSIYFHDFDPHSKHIQKMEVSGRQTFINVSHQLR